jgi:hypothetical protein
MCNKYVNVMLPLDVYGGTDADHVAVFNVGIGCEHTNRLKSANFVVPFTNIVLPPIAGLICVDTAPSSHGQYAIAGVSRVVIDVNIAEFNGAVPCPKRRFRPDASTGTYTSIPDVSQRWGQ